MFKLSDGYSGQTVLNRQTMQHRERGQTVLNRQTTQH